MRLRRKGPGGCPERVEKDEQAGGAEQQEEQVGGGQAMPGRGGFVRDPDPALDQGLAFRPDGDEGDRCSSGVLDAFDVLAGGAW